VVDAAECRPEGFRAIQVCLHEFGATIDEALGARSVPDSGANRKASL
jgi:hypothetical protein